MTRDDDHLEVVVGGQSWSFAAHDTVVIGRGVTSDVMLDDPGVSSRHLSVRRIGEQWIVTDHGSTNGTFLDGARFVQGEIGPQGCALQLGGTHDGVIVRLRVAPLARQDPQPLAAPIGLAAPRPLEPPQLPMLTVRGLQGGEDGRTWSSKRALRDDAVTRSVTIGRDEDSALVIDDLLVSRHHARVEYLVDGTVRIVDLGSVNGTFVDRRLAQPAIELVEGSLVSIGNAEFEFVSGALRPAGQQVGRSSAGFAVLGLTVANRLDNVSFALVPGSFLAVLGTSGAGKSTLLKAITGVEPASSGSVRFDDRDLYTNFRALRHRIGYVPQDDILHDQLTVDESLGFGAELRFPDASSEARQARIDEVIDDLGLQPHREKLVRQLSGGQRKRVSVGLELLHRPSLLILDEPTSGLDPGNERRLMTQLAQLAGDGSGRTVLVVTHSTESLHLCDQVLFLAKGGMTIYMGPPDLAAATLGAADFPEAFATAEETDRPDLLRDRFMASALAQPIKDLEALDVPSGNRPSGAASATTAKSTFQRDLRIFVRRYVRLLIADRKATLTIALQAPIIAVMVAIAAPSGTFDAFAPVPGAGNVIMALVLGSIYAGASNAAREVVKERAILRREQNFGISLAAYLLSKMIVLSAVTVAQAVVFVVIGTSRQGHIDGAAFLGPARFELLLVVALSGISAVALGLLLSSVVSSSDKASGVLPMVLLAQFVLAGLSFGVDKLGVQQASWLTSARWGFAAAASTVDYVGLGGCHEGNSPGAVGPACLGSWDRGAGVWLGDMFALGVLTALFLGVAWVVLARADPANSLGDDEPDLPEWKRLLGIRA